MQWAYHSEIEICGSVLYSKTTSIMLNINTLYLEINKIIGLH